MAGHVRLTPPPARTPSPLPSVRNPPPDRPNLLLITTDQQRWDALGCRGTPGYRTPLLDRLAARGMLFDNAYAPTPICTPCRVSMLTGLYPTRHGAFTTSTPSTS